MIEYFVFYISLVPEKHILFYRVFGWQPPSYAHLPLILNSDGSKLSKRQGDIKIENYRKEGIFPEALLNFVIDAGGGFTKDVERTKCKMHTMQELIKQVSTWGDVVWVMNLENIMILIFIKTDFLYGAGGNVVMHMVLYQLEFLSGALGGLL